MAYLGDGSRWGIAIQYSQEVDCLETGGGIVQALNAKLLDDTPFLVINSDVWTDYPLGNLATALTRSADKRAEAHLVLVPNPDHNVSGDFCLNESTGLLSTTLLSAKEPHERAVATCYTFAGISVMHRDLFAHKGAGKFPLAPLLKQAMGRELITGELYQGKWVDVGTPERLRGLN